MKRKRSSGVSIIEFTLALLILVPLMLGTAAVGINMVMQLETVQLARDAGRMYSNNVDFSLSGNQTILVSLSENLGLSSTAGTGNAVVVLSQVMYIDTGVCTGYGLVDSHGNPSGCTNYGKWAFTQRLTIGNSSLHTSALGSPITTGASPVTLDSAGRVSPASQAATNAGDVAVFNGLNPFVVAGNLDELPSGQVLYVSEAAAKGFKMPPFAPGGLMYSYTMF